MSFTVNRYVHTEWAEEEGDHSLQRTPFGADTAYVQALSETFPIFFHDALLQEVIATGEAFASLRDGITDLKKDQLDVSQRVLLEKIQEGRTLIENPYATTPMSMKSLISDIHKFLPIEQTIAADVTESAERVTTQWSPIWLRSLSSNILQNYWRASNGKPGSALTEDFSYRRHEGKDYIRLRFANNAGEIPDHILEQVKDGFRGAHGYENAESNAKSTGIGMAANTRAIEKYGGFVRVRNITYGEGEDAKPGAQIDVYLPVTNTEGIEIKDLEEEYR